jgi:formylglycine-generating enzyme required for sulfatase activity
VPVGSLPPNPLGLYEIAGNVHEMCQDTYDDIPERDLTDPIGRARKIMGGMHTSKVAKGGSWQDSPSFCFPGYRSSIDSQHRRNYIGFRLASSKGN